MSPRVPADAILDAARLHSLDRSGLLDAPPQAVFDRLTRLVQRVLDVPVALVTLVDEDRQVFLSAQGLVGPYAAARQTPLSHSFCQHVVGTGERLKVENALDHPLVRDNPAIKDFGVVAYLGMPLLTMDGQVLGALCAIDREQRAWTEADESAMADLAAMAANELAMRDLAGELEARIQAEAAARLRAEQELARKRRLEALGQLAGGVAHDFANVLQAVQAGIRVAGNNLERDPAKARRMLDAVAEAARRGGSITRRLLGFARRGELRVERVSVATVLVELREVLSHTLNRPGLDIRVEASDSLPPVMVDRGEMEAVLVNLATNARDAMPVGGCLVLSAGSEVVEQDEDHPAGLGPGNYIRLAARDNGVGMVAETLARAHKAFFTTKPEGEGTGLGLSMARDFALQAGGGLALASEPGQGTTVTLWLPVAEGNAERGAERRAERAGRVA